MKDRLPGAAALLSVWFVLTGCNHEPERLPADSRPPAVVRVQQIERKSRVATEEVVGTVRAKLHAVIEAKLSARIEEMPAAPGLNVKAGDLLARLDAREVQARYDRALALRQQAEADLQRANTLVAQKILSPAEFDTVQSRFRVDDAAATEAQTLLGYTKVTAPFDGIVTRKYADVGDLAAPGKPLLEMEDSRELRLEAGVPEAVVGRLALGDKLSVRVSSLSNELVGVVSEISPAADPGSRTFLVKCDLPPAPGLRAGRFGRAAMPVGETSALRVPVSAVLRRGQLELLFVATGGHAEMRIVKTGKRVGNEVELVSGVDAGEAVIVENAAGLVDGQPVEVK